MPPDNMILAYKFLRMSASHLMTLRKENLLWTDGSWNPLAPVPVKLCRSTTMTKRVTHDAGPRIDHQATHSLRDPPRHERALDPSRDLAVMTDNPVITAVGSERILAPVPSRDIPPEGEENERNTTHQLSIPNAPAGSVEHLRRNLS